MVSSGGQQGIRVTETDKWPQGTAGTSAGRQQLQVGLAVAGTYRALQAYNKEWLYVELCKLLMTYPGQRLVPRSFKVLQDIV